MKIELKEINCVVLAEINSKNIVINNTEDALDLIGNCSYQGSNKIILNERNLTPDFFDLKTRIAGDILQKFSTYNMRLAIVGNFSKFTSKSLHDFIYESNKTGRIVFVNSIEEARKSLAK